MRKWILRGLMACVLLAGVLLGAGPGFAQETTPDRGYWRAASTNAAAITGDLVIANAKLTMNFTAFPLAQIRALKPEEISAAFDADLNAAGNGYLYRLNVAPDKRFLHHNTLCGSEATQWMATYVADRTLRVAFFSGDDMPVMTFDAMQNSTVLCGTFTYVR